MIALNIVTGLLAVWTLLRFLPAGWDGRAPLPYFISFVRFLWIPAAVCLVLGAVTGSTFATLLSAGIMVVIAFVNSPWHRRRVSRATGRGIQLDSGARSHTDGTEAATETADATVPTTGSSNNNGTNSDDDNKTACKTANCLSAKLNVMTLNCRFGKADAGAIVTEVRERNIAVLALQELTPELVRALDDAGLAQLLPYRQLGRHQASDNGGFNGIWTVDKPEDSAARSVDIEAADAPYAQVGGITFVSAHPKSPMRGCREWSAGIRALGTLAEQPFADRGTPAAHDVAARDTGMASRNKTSTSAAAATAVPAAVVIMGDLNSSLSHPSFRALLRSGFTDAGLAEHHRTVASFPAWLRWPRLELDHVLASAPLIPTDAMAVSVPGTDHLALVARVRRR